MVHSSNKIHLIGLKKFYLFPGSKNGHFMPDAPILFHEVIASYKLVSEFYDISCLLHRHIFAYKIFLKQNKNILFFTVYILSYHFYDAVR